MSFAMVISSSVYLPIAERTTTTSLPFLYSSIHLPATLKIRSLFATEVPPNFFTINIASLPKRSVFHTDHRDHTAV